HRAEICRRFWKLKHGAGHVLYSISSVSIHFGCDRIELEARITLRHYCFKPSRQQIVSNRGWKFGSRTSRKSLESHYVGDGSYKFPSANPASVDDVVPVGSQHLTCGWEFSELSGKFSPASGIGHCALHPAREKAYD